MKRKLSFLFLSALTIPFFMGSCSDDKEEQEVKPATDLVVDNNSVTLLQGDEITVSITSGNGDYSDCDRPERFCGGDCGESESI